MTGKEILNILMFLDKHEIDYRLTSNFCCGYVFYFLDGSVYPRRYHDAALENNTDYKIISESTESMIKRLESCVLKKDWVYRIEGKDINDTFKQVKELLTEKCNYT